ncbi:MAG: chromate transporter [Bacillota bacterium]
MDDDLRLEGFKKAGPDASLFQLFFMFLKIGAFTFGGGVAMVPLLQAELVEKKRWMDDHKFVDCLVLAQSVPGPIIVNLSVISGYRLQGLKGSLCSLLGAVLPSFLLILAVVVFLWQYRENPLAHGVFQGIRPAVTALIAASAVKLGRAVLKNRPSLLLFTLFLGGLIVFNIHPLFVIIGGALAGLFLPLQQVEAKEVKE